MKDPVRVVSFVIALAIWMALNSVFMRLLVAPLSWFDPIAAGRLIHRQMNLWARTVIALARQVAHVSIRVEGAAPPGDGRCLIIANHQGLLDVIVLVTYFNRQRIKFAMKKELARGVPNVSLAARSVVSRSSTAAPVARPRPHRSRACAGRSKRRRRTAPSFPRARAAVTARSDPSKRQGRLC